MYYLVMIIENKWIMKTNNLPYFTVIIPAKDRAEFIGHTIRTCMLQDYPNFEIIVSDDCSEDNSVEVIRELAQIDSRIKLFAHEKHLGMRDNFEFALNQVKPGYVMALGGDDGLTPGCIWRMYEIIKDTGKQLLTWTPAGFNYPTPEGNEGKFWVKRPKCKKVQIKKSNDFLNSIAKSFRYHPNDDCPMFYVKGVASTELVDRVKSRTSDGCFYYCPTPDGFSGVVLAGEVEEYAFTYEPLSIMGTTHKSQGKNYKRNDDKSRAEAQQFFNDNIRRTMHKELASQQYSPLIPLMTADYLLTARDLPGWPGKFEDISFEGLLKASFHALATAEFAPEVMQREVDILRNIAKQHNLLDLHDILLNTTKRRIQTGSSINKFMITNSIRFNAVDLGLYNIFDAAIATGFVFNFMKWFTLKQIPLMVWNTLQFYRNSRRYKEEPLSITVK